ncbi:hypothetical protein PF004_g30845 [Phytophthora fragariae]|uniref:Secreted protein n=1 Tax=Phytophthora fragariae TaxID=53985 RepID=A0A6G0MBG6_9STRA|nr:hypothetical protein PF004_g30845 [Phytophthora fragariae]
MRGMSAPFFSIAHWISWAKAMGRSLGGSPRCCRWALVFRTGSGTFGAESHSLSRASSCYASNCTLEPQPPTYFSPKAYACLPRCREA